MVFGQAHVAVRYGVSVKACNAAESHPGPAFGGLFSSSGRRCIACPVIQTAQRGAPCRKTRRDHQMGYNRLPLVLNVFLKRFHTAARQFVCALVVRVARMAFDPVPGDIMAVAGCV